MGSTISHCKTQASEYQVPLPLPPRAFELIKFAHDRDHFVRAITRSISDYIHKKLEIYGNMDVFMDIVES